MNSWTTKSPLFPESWKYWKLKSPTFSIILEILEISISWISHILEILEIHFFYFPLSWKYWKLKSPLFPGSWKYGRRAGEGGRAAPGVVLRCLGLFLDPVPRILWQVQSQEIALFLDFGSLICSIWSLLSLIEPYWTLLSLIEAYWALTVKQ